MRAKGPWFCGTCKARVLKPRMLRDITGGGRRFVTVAWCSQECADAWAHRFTHSGKLARRVEHYDEQGNLIGFHVQGRFVPLSEIDAAEGSPGEE